MRLDEMCQAVEEAEETLRRADIIASKLARMIRGRLRKCDYPTLCELKKELRDFNICTGEWKDQ